LPTKQQIADAKDRLDHVADVYWGIHGSCPRGSAPFQSDQIVERVLADYALTGKVPIDTLKKRAQKRLKGLDETPS